MKPRITAMVMVTAYLGFYLGNRYMGSYMLDAASWWVLGHLLVGTFLTSSSAAILNQVIERQQDSCMERTRHRPIPAGKITAGRAALLGLSLGAAGVSYLAVFNNLLTAGLSLATILLYLLVYTPLKKITVWNTLAGAIPGAIPPLGGWVAATGSLDAPSWLLFGIIFCWQIPHFLTIALIYARDYQRGEFRMLPKEYPNSKVTGYHILFSTLALIGTSSGLFLARLVSMVYAVGAGLLGLGFLTFVLLLFSRQDPVNARRVMLASIVYLPILLLLTLVD